MPTFRLIEGVRDMKLPHPEARLADCCWLPRMAAKIRIQQNAGLPLSYRVAFGSRLGVDGYFLRHFRLTMPAVIAAVRRAPDDAGLARWFLGRSHVSTASIQSWNALAVRLGARGQPAHLIFQVVRRVLYPKTADSPVETIFAAIEQDENLPPEPQNPA